MYIYLFNFSSSSCNSREHWSLDTYRLFIQCVCVCVCVGGHIGVVWRVFVLYASACLYLEWDRVIQSAYLSDILYSAINRSGTRASPRRDDSPYRYHNIQSVPAVREHSVVLTGISGFKPACQFVSRHQSALSCVLNTEELISNSVCKFSIYNGFNTYFTDELSDFWVTLYSSWKFKEWL
jgi:hypothetical protein